MKDHTRKALLMQSTSVIALKSVEYDNSVIPQRREVETIIFESDTGISDEDRELADEIIARQQFNENSYAAIAESENIEEEWEEVAGEHQEVLDAIEAHNSGEEN